jgi:pimeloyl-ACP methyl ester carboxylesterase
MTAHALNETQVSWQVDGIDVNASLTQPEGSGPFPAVIMVAGSGPTDRNWNTPLIPGTNGSAALLARLLTDQGYITLRYDKRASGPQGQQNATRMAGKISMQGHLEELAGGVKLLAERRDVNPKQIFALTNSEGCIHALNYQLQAADLPFAGLVLTAAPSRPIGAVALAQVEAQVKSLPQGAAWLAAYRAAIDDFTAARPVKIDQNLPEGMRAVLLGITNPLNQPFSRELWVTEPAALLTDIKVPALVLIGKKDIQVDWQSDGVIFENLAQTHPNITVAYLENANHVLKYEPRPRTTLSPADAVAAYNAGESLLDPEAEKAITGWLAAHS